MDEILNMLNEQQRAAVVHEGSPLLILAGAGSGKTRVITTKIAYLIAEKNVNPQSILSVTFTKKAANEMKERAVMLDERAAYSQIRTFHSFGAWFLRRYAEVAGLEPTFTVYDDADMALILKEVVKSLSLNLSLKEIKTVSKQIALAKDYCLRPEDDLSFIASDFDLPKIYAAYENKLRATGNTDFGDLIMMPVKILESVPEIAQYIHNKFKVIFVDEYQDSNIAQYKLLQRLSGVEDGNDCYVCVVGDDDQSIYHFRGAEVDNILSFPKKFKGTEIIRLERNYRSTSQILELASSVVQKNVNRLGKTLVADRGKGAKPCLVFVYDQNEEVNLVADTISKDVMAGGKYSDWAILYRTNAQSLGFEKEFLRRKIPYIVVGALKFYEREEIKDVLAYLSFYANRRDMVAFRRIINKPTRGIGPATQNKIIAAAMSLDQNGNSVYNNLITTLKNMDSTFKGKAREGVHSFIKIFSDLEKFISNEEKDGDTLSNFIKMLIKESGLDEFHKAGDIIEGTQRVANLQEFVNSAFAYPCTVDGLVEFLDAIDLDRSLEVENDKIEEEPITLITVHNTKGLEFKKVIITGMEEGVFPHSGKVGAELEEERRLFYVGITRAKDQLIVTSSGARMLYGFWQKMAPSRFVVDSLDKFSVMGRIPYGLIDNKDFNKDSSLDSKWKKGTRVYHDLYGEGEVINKFYNEDEFIIKVRFAEGVKRFMPKYMENILTIIKD